MTTVRREGTVLPLAVLVAASDPGELRDSLRRARDAGFSAVQLWVRYEADDAAWAAIGRELADLDLRAVALGGYANPLHPDRDERATGLAALREAIERAPAFGAATVVTWSGTRNPAMFDDHPENGSAAAWDDLVAHLREAGGWAEKAGVTLALEPFHNHVASTPERLRDLLEEAASPAVGAVMDPPNFLKADAIEEVNDRMPAMFATLAGRIAIVHAKDIARPGAGETTFLNSGVRLPPPGTGIMDYALYAQLIRHHYDGPEVVEHVTPETIEPARMHVARHLEVRE